LLAANEDSLRQLAEIESDFAKAMQSQMEKMWAAKLGLGTFHAALFSDLETLMVQTPVDYTLFFRELSMVPDDIASLKKSFYKDSRSAMVSLHPTYETDPEGMENRWSEWLTKWKSLIGSTATTDANTAPPCSREELARQMKLVNPKYSLREWFVAPAYQQATAGNYSLVRELQDVMTQPYAEQSKEVDAKYYKLKPPESFEVGGLSHYSCSS
jgi:uncharacterized protein YdiU (UPF0061 family)